jgi:hypothetical protein
LKVDLVIDLATQDAKWIQVILAFTNGHKLKGCPGAIESEKVFLAISGHYRLLSY